MSFLNTTININDLPDSEDSTPVPAGVYQVLVTGSELKNTKAGTGQYISLTLKVQGGEFNNRVIFDNVNIANPNETAQRIGLASLKKIMKSMNLTSVQDTDQLIGGNLVVKVVVEKNDTYGDRNSVKDYQSTGGDISPSMPAQQQMQHTQQSPQIPGYPQQQPVPSADQPW